ncbi:hypothetical protein BU57_29860 [Escherichia coli O121:H19 str. 2011C-3609]|nr:hypothetical protein BU57_29860 [Escherichia coli O121:H19 str. 2011C-3609]
MKTAWKSLTGIVKLSSVRRPDKAFTPHLAFGSRCPMRRWRVLSCLHNFHILHPATTVYPVTTSPAGGVSSSSSIVRAISRSPITT